MIKLFISHNCPHCKKALEEISKSCCDYEIIDVDKNPEIADKHCVLLVPTAITEDGRKIHAMEALQECQRTCQIKKENQMNTTSS